MVIKWTGRWSSLALLGILVLGNFSPARGEIVLEYVTPTEESSPADLAFDAQGNLWFTELNGNRIGKLVLSQAKSLTSQGITEYNLPHPHSKPHYLTVAKNGMIWFTEGANRIGKLDPKTGKIEEFDIPTPHSEPYEIAEGPDGGIWFLEFQTNKIGHLEPVSGRITEYPIGPGHPRSLGITNNQIWYTQGGIPWVNIFFSKVGSFDPKTGNITEIKIPPENSVPHSLTVCLKGEIWFTQEHAGKLARLDPKAAQPKVLEYHLDKNRFPKGLVIKDKVVWFTVANPAAIGSLELSQAQPGTGKGLRYYKLPDPASHPTEITLDPQGGIWFTLTGDFAAGKYNNRIGKLIP